MSNKVIWSGVALSGLGLGYFFPMLLPIGAVVLIAGCVLLWLNK